MSPLLEVADLSAGHGLLTAVREMSLEVREGETVALVGANGAGKTTLLRTIAGAHHATHGSVVFDGEVMHAAITAKIRSEPPLRFDLGIYLPADLTADQARAAEELTAQCLRAIGFTYGSTHTEVIFTEEGPRLVEIAGRLGGGRIPTDLVPLVYGVDLATESIRTCMGDKPSLERRHTRGAALILLDEYS